MAQTSKESRKLLLLTTVELRPGQSHKIEVYAGDDVLVSSLAFIVIKNIFLDSQVFKPFINARISTLGLIEPD